MKISSVILATVFLGLITHVGPRCLDPIHGSLDRTIGARTHHGRDRYRITMTRRTGKMSPELEALKARQSEIGTRIRDVENALRKIQASEGTLKRRVDALKRRGRQAAGFSGGEEVIRALEASKCALNDHMDALARERGAFEGFLEQLKNEQASLKVEVDLFQVSEERARTEKFLTGSEGGPLDDLSLEVRRNRARAADSQGGGIVY